MAVDWNKDQRIAAKDIARNGCAITLKVKSSSAYNTVTRRNESVWAEFPTTCIFTIFSAVEIKNEPIEANDKKIIMPVLGIPDLIKEQPESVNIVFNGTTMSAVTIKPIMPGGVAILYKIHLR